MTQKSVKSDLSIFTLEFMQHRLGILFLFLSLFVASANRAWACGNCSAGKCGNASSEKSCCAKKNRGNSARCAEKTSANEQNQPTHKCPENKGCGGCGCPCGPVSNSHPGGFLAELPPELNPLSIQSEDALRQAFYFADHIPEAVYLPIWQPPKLVA